jgi:hypothetical protein
MCPRSTHTCKRCWNSLVLTPHHLSRRLRNLYNNFYLPWEATIAPKEAPSDLRTRITSASSFVVLVLAKLERRGQKKSGNYMREIRLLSECLLFVIPGYSKHTCSVAFWIASFGRTLAELTGWLAFPQRSTHSADSRFRVKKIEVPTGGALVILERSRRTSHSTNRGRLPTGLAQITADMLFSSISNRL